MLNPDLSARPRPKEVVENLRCARTIVLEARETLYRFASTTWHPDFWFASPWWLRFQDFDIVQKHIAGGVLPNWIIRTALGVQVSWENRVDLVVRAKLREPIGAYIGKARAQFERAPNGMVLRWGPRAMGTPSTSSSSSSPGSAVRRASRRRAGGSSRSTTTRSPSRASSPGSPLRAVDFSPEDAIPSQRITVHQERMTMVEHKTRAAPANLEVVDDEMAAVLRSKTPAERLEIAAGMWRFARQMILNVLRKEHPDWDDSQLQRETARRLSQGAV